MKSSEIMMPWGEYNHSMAVDNIIEHLTWGETVPCVSGGNGGNGYGDIQVNSDKLGEYRELLNSCKFNNDPEVADDFKDFIDFDDYTDCVQFTLPSGGWMQFLLW